MIAIEKKLVAGLSAAFALLVLIAAAAGWNAVQFDQTFRRVARTHEVLGHLEQVLTGLLSMQASSRGFVLSGSDEMLAPFHSGHETVRTSLQRLRRLTTDNRLLQQQLVELEPLLQDAIAVLEARISTRRARGLEAARQTAEFLRDQHGVENIRRIIHDLEADERQLLNTRVAQTQKAARATIETAAVGELVALTFLVALAFRIRRDFRERLRVEEALHQSERMFQRLFDNAPDAIIQVNSRGELVRANHKVEGLFGWSRGELAGQPLDVLLPERHRVRHAGHVTAYFAAPRTRAMGAGLALFGRRKDGTEFPVDIMLSPIETEGDVQSLAVIRDVTEQRRNDERIRQLNLDLQLQNARLEIANKELESFSYSVSHDLRAPLRHIDGFANLLSKHASGQLDEKGQRFLTVISDSARRMGQLIDDLLMFSRMGRAQMTPGGIDQEQLVASVIRESGFDRDARIQWSVAPLPPVHADESMLRQVWFNLLDNAIKYSSHATPPRIEIGTLRDKASPNEQVFFVRDNGVGFDMKYAAKLFGVFQRLHSEAEFEGTGIGLANVRRIITRHGGRTWAESRVGGGSTFYFSIPVSTHLPA